MARLNCGNVVIAMSKLLVARRIPGESAQPTAEDQELASRWYEQLPQRDIEEEQGPDLSSSFLVFAAQEKGDIASADITRLLKAQRRFMTDKFSEAIRECAT